MSDPQSVDHDRQSRSPRNPVAHPRAVGSPLPRGSSRRAPYPPEENETRQLAPPPPGRTLAESADPSANDTSNVHRLVNAVRSAIPFVQRLLPLLDGNIASAMANVLTSHPQKSAPPVNLAPLEDSVSALELQQRELRAQVVEQNTSLKRVEDQLEMVREATDRNTLEQQELMEDLKSVGTKVNLVALAALALLAISVLLNLVLYLHIQRVLP